MKRLLLLVFIFTAACVQPGGGSLKYTVKVSSECSTGVEKPKVFGGSGVVRIAAQMEVPNPCYNASVDVRREGDSISVEITPVDLNKMCIECIGRLNVEVEISGIKPGSYELNLMLPGESYVYRVDVK